MCTWNFWRSRFFANWTNAAKFSTDAELYDKMTNMYTLVATVSGLTAGFVFGNIGTRFEEDASRTATVDLETRTNYYGLAIGISFLLAITSTVAAALLYGSVVLIGTKGAVHFVNAYYVVLDMPIVLMVGGIVAMLGAGGIQLGVTYADWVAWAGRGFGLVLFVLFAGFFFHIVFWNYRYLSNTAKEAEERRAAAAADGSDVELARVSDSAGGSHQA